MIRTYSELKSLDTFEERFEYLKLHGRVGKDTFGYDRYLNQRFYTSVEWKHARRNVIARDMGFDLGLEGHDIYGKVFVHHMNPMIADDLLQHNEDILDPEYLITVSFETHNAIHYGDQSMLRQPYVERRPGDTNLW